MLIGMALIIGLLIVIGIYSHYTDPERQIWQFRHLHYEVKLQPDGSAVVSERRDYDFERGSYTFAWFDLALEAEDVVVLEDGQPYARLDAPSSSRPEGSFALSLNQDESSYRVEWYYRAEGPQERSFEIRYRIPDAALAYDDCTVYFQKFLSESNETKIAQITVGIQLPDGVSPENTQIFGHGPAYGELYFDPDNPARVNMLVDDIESGRYVEARFLLPKGILPAATRRQGRVYNEILHEELAAAAKTDREMLIGRISFVLALVLVLLLLAATVFLRLKHKAHYSRLKPAASPAYLRQVPSALPPVIAARLHAFYKRPPDKAGLISLCLLDLISRRVLAVNTRLEGRKEVVYLTRQPGEHSLLDCERPIMNFLFNDVASGRDYLTLRELRRYCRAQRHYREITHLLNSFGSKCDSLWNKYGFAEKQRNQVPRSLLALRAAAAIAGGGGLFLLFFLFFPALSAAAWTLLAGGAAVFFLNLIFCSKKRLLTQRGEDELALWQALRRFFNDLTAFEEKELPEIGLWEKLLVYASALGVADKVLSQLQIRYPQLNDPYYMRQHFYVYSGLHLNGRGAGSLSGLQNSLSSSFRNAQSVVTSRTSSGGGGGFSGGGSSGGGGAGGSSGGGVG